MRRGFTGLSAMVQTTLQQSTLSGHVFVFRGRRGHVIKLLWHDGDGLRIFHKRFPPQRQVLVAGGEADALRAIIAVQRLQILSNDNEIEHPKLLVAKLRRMQFGRRSEKVTQQIEQLELKLGEDASGVLEYIPASYVVIRPMRPRMCCGRCDTILQAPAPSRPVERGLGGPGLLAHVLTAKFCDHLPFFRQSDIYAREGVDLERQCEGIAIPSPLKI
jgi:transposase